MGPAEEGGVIIWGCWGGCESMGSTGREVVNAQGPWGEGLRLVYRQKVKCFFKF